MTTPFIIVPARNQDYVGRKLQELNRIGLPFIIICGENLRRPRVLYRKASGKWDAINYGAKFIPTHTDLVILNDVDTKIYHLDRALDLMSSSEIDVAFCKVRVTSGPQQKFYKVLDPIRKRLPIAASGELMLIKRRLFDQLVPLPPSTAEDTYMMFRALELGRKVKLCDEAFVTTSRDSGGSNFTQEQMYKMRTTLGIFQALRLSRPPAAIRAFYLMLPLVAVLLALGGPDGRAWTMGIERATVSHFLRRYASRF